MLKLLSKNRSFLYKFIQNCHFKFSNEIKLTKHINIVSISGVLLLVNWSITCHSWSCDINMAAPVRGRPALCGITLFFFFSITLMYLESSFHESVHHFNYTSQKCILFCNIFNNYFLSALLKSKSKSSAATHVYLQLSLSLQKLLQCYLITYQTTPKAPYPIGLSGSISSCCCK